MKKLLKRSIALLCVMAMLLSALPFAFAAEGDAKFVVLSTTDMHGRCWDTNVLTDGGMSNSMLNVSTAVAKLRETYGENVVLVDNGDTYQGTPVSTYQISQYTQGATTDPNPMAISMKYIGYDVANVGNHEFNYAWNTMSDIYDYLEADIEGMSRVAAACANLYYDGSDGIHPAGTNVMTPFITKDVKDSNGDAVKIAILCFVTPDCTRWDVPNNYPGMQFYHPENPNRSIRWEAEKWLAEIEANVAPDFTIVAFHSGLGDGSADDELVYGENTENQVLSMISGTTGIDMVIAGHDHSEGYSNEIYKNAVGEDVLVVNGAGNSLTAAVFSIAADGTIALESKENRKLSNYAADPALKELIAPYAEDASDYVNAACGTAIGDWNYTTKFYLEQSDTMDLIGRAQMAQGTVHLAEKYDTEEELAALYDATGLDHLTVDLSSTSVVINGSYNVKAGDLSMKDIYRMYRYDNSLYLLPVTGAEIKDILEFNAATHLRVVTSSGTPVFSTTGDDFTNPIFYGIDFKYDMSREKFDRIIDLKFANGAEVIEDKVYILAVNNYHLGNASGPFASYTTEDCIWSQTDDMGGGFVQDLIAEFLTAETEENGGVAPVPSNWEIVYTGEIEVGEATGKYILDMVEEPEALVDGDVVVIHHVAGNQLMTNAASGSKLAPSDDVSIGDKQLGTNDATALFTVKIGDDGYIRFVDEEGKYVTSGTTGNALTMNDAEDPCSLWELEATEGGFYIHNVNAVYNGNANQYLEVYGGAFTTYGLGSGGAAYLFNIYRLPEYPVPPEELPEEGIVILYTNDVHTYIDKDLSYSSVAALKKELAETNSVLLVDAGDHAQGTAYGAMDKGATIIELMNAAGYDLATMGNHEFDYGMERALELVGEAAFPYVSANFYHLVDGVRGENVLDAYKIFEADGKKIAIIGVTTPETYTKSTPKYFQDAEGNYIYGIAGGEDGAALYADVQAAIDAAAEEGADYIIALGHTGDDPSSKPWTSEEIIANTTGLDAFIDGHSHSAVPMKEVADKEGATVILTQTGNYFDSIGKMVINEEGIKAELITEYEGSDDAVKAIADEWIAEVDELLNVKIAESEVDFRIDTVTGQDEEGKDIVERLVRKQETNLGDFAADALYYLFSETEGLDVDVAIMNGGGIRANHPAGDVTYKTCKTVHTFGNVACLMTITGQQLLDALEWGAKDVGVGENGGFLHVSGITYEIHSYIPSTVQSENKIWTGAPTGEYRVKNVMVGGEPLDVEASYNLAGYNYTLRDMGDGFDMFDGATLVKDYVMEDYMVLANYAKSFPTNEEGMPVIKADNSVLGANYAEITGEGRITIVAEKEIENPFTDVPDDVWYTDYVLALNELGIIKGMTKDTFEPETNVTRAQFAAMLSRMFEMPSDEQIDAIENPFTDVKEGDWFREEVLYMYAAGVIKGTTETTFDPNASITREQMVTMLYRLQKNMDAHKGASCVADFNDGDKVSPFARKAMDWAIENGIINGMGGNMLEPQGLTTRAQAAKVIYVFIALNLEG